MTDATDSPAPESKGILQELVRSSGHELRNALNGLVVNLEVVRARTAAAAVSAEPFMGQAAEQAEESIRLAEAAIALMMLLAKSLPAVSGSAMSGAQRQVRLEAGSESERLEKALAPLVARRVVSVETSGSTVILRIPEDSPE